MNWIYQTIVIHHLIDNNQNEIIFISKKFETLEKKIRYHRAGNCVENPIENTFSTTRDPNENAFLLSLFLS